MRVVLLLLLGITGCSGITHEAVSAPPDVRAVRFVSPKPGVLSQLGRADLWIEVFVPRQPEHQWLVVEWTSDVGETGSFLVQLGEGRVPAAHSRWLKSLPAGRYLFLASLYGPGNERLAVDTVRLQIGFPEDW